MYDDRISAGALLGERLLDRGVSPDVVFAVPPGGVRIASPVCDRFHTALGLAVAELIRPPSADSRPVGAVTDGGTTWYDDDRLAAFDVDRTKLGTVRTEALREARNKRGVYDDVGSNPDPTGTSVVVTEAITSGTCLKACAAALGRSEDCHTVVAAPVGSADAVAEVATVADDVVVDETVSETRIHDTFYDRLEAPVVPEQPDGG